MFLALQQKVYKKYGETILIADPQDNVKINKGSKLTGKTEVTGVTDVPHIFTSDHIAAIRKQLTNIFKMHSSKKLPRIPKILDQFNNGTAKARICSGFGSRSWRSV